MKFRHLGFALCAITCVAPQARGQTRHGRHRTTSTTATTGQTAHGTTDAAAGATTAGATTTPDTRPSVPVQPLAPGEPIGNRISRARSLLEQLEFDQVVAQLEPVYNAPSISPTLAIEAALVETEALVQLHDTTRAAGVCARAVVAANYDPDVAHQQPARVQAVCRVAADEARRRLVTERGIRIENVDVRPGPVAWNPVRVSVRFAGDLTGLTTQSEVTVGDAPPVTATLPNGGQPVRAATLDANLATPGARISVTPVVRDSFGVLLQSPSPTTALVPRDESAVRFAIGSDEGPLRIDGRLVGQRVRIGETLPVPLGSHRLEVRTAGGYTSRASVVLRAGDVALLTLHTSPGSAGFEVAKWGTTGGAALLLAFGGVFQLLGHLNAQQYQLYAQETDPASGLPLIRYSDVHAVDQARNLDQEIAAGFFIGGGALAIVATVLWVTQPHVRPESNAAGRSTALVRPRLNGFELQF